MKKIRTYRAFSIILSVLLLTGIVILFIIFQNQIINPEPTNLSPNFIYVTLLIQVVLLVLLLATNLAMSKHTTIVNAPLKTEAQTDVAQEKIPEEAEKENKEKDKTEEAEQNVETDISPVVKKIVPRYANTKDPDKFTERLLINMANEFEIVEGLFYIKTKGGVYSISGLYAYFADEKPKDFKEGEGLNGQVIKNKTTLNVKNVPEEYIKVLSGLGESSPKHMLIVPILHEEEPVGLLELASFKEFDAEKENTISKLSTYIGEGVNSILKGDKK